MKYFWRCSLQTWLHLLSVGLLPQSAATPHPFNEDDLVSWRGIRCFHFTGLLDSSETGVHSAPLVLLETNGQNPPLPSWALFIHPFPPPLLTFPSYSDTSSVKADTLFKSEHIWGKSPNVCWGWYRDMEKLISLQFLAHENSSRTLVTTTDLLINDCPRGRLVCDMN